MLRIDIITNLDTLDLEPLYTIAKHTCPFSSKAFLSALQASQSIDGNTGWNSHHLAIYHDKQLVGFMPMYKKSHSYGEYIFDFAWANAYQQHGLNYYPKLVAAVPFSPVPGSRLIHDPAFTPQDITRVITAFLKQYCQQNAISSIHVLFNNAVESNLLDSDGILQRHSVQFHWKNNHYHNMDDFLQSLKSRKRKNIIKERSLLQRQGWHFEQYRGEQIQAQHIEFFYQCYIDTYQKLSGHQGYLNHQFFQRLLQNMPDNLMLVIGYDNDTPRSAALFIVSDDTLYGRYWGCIKHTDGAHFETCYYQGIEYCITHKLKHFNPGTQGEHKISRGFLPVKCYSNHWLCNTEFQHAVSNFLHQEKRHIAQYSADAEQLSPYK